MSITQPIIFSIGVIGSDKVKANLAMAGAAVGALAIGFSKLYKAADEYGDALAALSVDMTKFNTETKGLIGTTESLQGANKLAAAGAKVTAEQMAAIGKAAIVVSRATGKDATESFNRLTESIAKGSSRALKEIGIDLVNTEDLVKAQVEALDKVVGTWKDVKIEIEDANELFFSLGNNIGTASAQMTTSVGTIFKTTLEKLPLIGDGLRSINDFLSESTSLWERTGGAMYEFKNIGVETGIVIDMITAKLTGNLAAQAAAAGRWKGFIAGLKEVEAERRAGVARGTSQSVSDDLEPLQTITAATPRRRGGVGSRRRPTAQSVEEDLLSAYGKTNAISVPGGDIYEDPFLQEEIDASQKKLEVRELSLAQQWQLELDAAEAEKKLAEEKHEWLLQHSEEYARAQRALALETSLTYAEGVGQIFADMSSLMETESKSAFEAGKKMAIASALINTFLAAIKAYQSLAGIPVVGPILGIAAAAAAITAGMVQVSNIRKTTFEGGGSGSASAGGSSYSSGVSSSGYPATTDGGGGGATPISISLSVGDEPFGDVMVRINNKRSQQGRAAFKAA